jgi:hypothetical protein
VRLSMRSSDVYAETVVKVIPSDFTCEQQQGGSARFLFDPASAAGVN